MTNRAVAALCTLTTAIFGIALSVSGCAHEQHASVREPSEMVLAGIPIRLVDVNVPDTPEVKKALVVHQNGGPVLAVYLNADGSVVGYGFGDPKHKIAYATLNQNRLSWFSVYGTEETPVMFLDAATTVDTSGTIRYVKTAQEYKDGDDLLRYRPVGEMYIDIDCDGQFDAKDVYNDESERLSQWIFIDGQWECLAVFDPPIGWREPGYIGTRTHSAYSEKGDQAQHFGFEPGRGWTRRSDSEQ